MYNTTRTSGTLLVGRYSRLTHPTRWLMTLGSYALIPVSRKSCGKKEPRMRNVSLGCSSLASASASIMSSLILGGHATCCQMGKE